MKESPISLHSKQCTSAGFWVRFAAIWIDSLVIYGATHGVVALGRLFATYIPFELTAVVLALVYFVLLIGWKGQTVGKMICGLTVLTKDGRRVSYFTAFLREFIGKAIIGVIVPVGLVWIIIAIFGSDKLYKLFSFLAPVVVLLALVGFLIHYILAKRTWYDCIARTAVVQDIPSRQRARWALALVLGISALSVGIKGAEYVSIYNTSSEMSPHSRAKTPYDDRAPSILTEVSSLSADEDSVFVRWLDKNGRDPVDYAVEVATRHQVTIFGEFHFNQGHVLFLHEIIPALYHRAGVRCLGMEKCTREDNETINRLITAPRYDRELALQIGRNEPWHGWGGKEYWDMLEVVWRLNKSLPEGQQKMRVVGIDSQWDGPSFTLTIAGDDAAEGPFWEKLRIIRALRDVSSLVLRDELMAKEVEKEIIEKGERGIVWVGWNHAFIRYKQRYQRKGRMAYMLHQKYGDKVFQVKLHSHDTSPKVIDPDYQGPEPMMANFLERIMAARGHTPVGFDVTSSPFALLRDSTSYYYHFQPRVGFGDIASGYVYLEPREAFQQCQWAEGFITSKMFARYKPFYEARAGTTFRNGEEVNEHMSRGLRQGR